MSELDSISTNLGYGSYDDFMSAMGGDENAGYQQNQQAMFNDPAYQAYQASIANKTSNGNIFSGDDGIFAGMGPNDSILSRLGQAGQKFTDPLYQLLPDSAYTHTIDSAMGLGNDVADASNQAANRVGAPAAELDSNINPARLLSSGVDDLSRGIEQRPVDAAVTYFGGSALVGAAGGGSGGAAGGGTISPGLADSAAAFGDSAGAAVGGGAGAATTSLGPVIVNGAGALALPAPVLAGTFAAAQNALQPQTQTQQPTTTLDPVYAAPGTSGGAGGVDTALEIGGSLGGLGTGLSNMSGSSGSGTGTTETPKTSGFNFKDAKNIFDIGSSLYGLYTGYQDRQNAQDMQKASDPFGPYRASYADQLQKLMADPSSITSDPGYKFQFDQGQQGLERSMAAKGFLGSGNMAIALQKYGQDYASNYLSQKEQFLANLGGAGISPNFGASVQANNLGLNTMSSSLASLGYTMGNKDNWDWLSKMFGS